MDVWDGANPPPDPLPPGKWNGGLPAGGPHTFKGVIYVLTANASNGTGWASDTTYDGSGMGAMFYLEPGVIPGFSLATFKNFRAPDPAQGDMFPGADTYAGLSVFQSRSSPPVNVTWSGSNTWSFVGTLYLPQTNVQLTTRPREGVAAPTPTQLIVNTLSLSQNAMINVNYNGVFPGTGNYTRALVNVKPPPP